MERTAADMARVYLLLLWEQNGSDTVGHVPGWGQGDHEDRAAYERSLGPGPMLVMLPSSHGCICKRGDKTAMLWRRSQRAWQGTFKGLESRNREPEQRGVPEGLRGTNKQKRW